MLKLFILLFILLKCLLITYSQQIENRIWFQMLKTNLTNVTMDLKDYLVNFFLKFFKAKEANCQSVSNKCKSFPTMPKGRQYHTSILYTTYNKTQEDSMCPTNLCGPLCTSRNNICYVSDSSAKNYPLPEPNEGLKNFYGPTNESCPNECCDKNNEYCFRTYANTGYPIVRDEEEMLIFGGLRQNEVVFNGTNIADFCNFDRDFKLSPNFAYAMNTLFLINNCGYEILNELWAYNIKRNEWKYIKPYVDDSQASLQQKPTSRYGHAAVYVELIDDTYKDNIITRKYMYIYGGFSLYCENACDDMWRYEIAYAPQRYYPNPNFYIGGDTNLQTSKWNRGNVWDEVYPASTLSPGKRLFHSMVVDPEYKYIYLFGGISVNDDGKQFLNNDMWRYDLKYNIWDKLVVQGIKKITRPIIYWDGTTENINVSTKEYNEKTDTYQTGFNTETSYLPRNYIKILFYIEIRSGASFEIFTRGDNMKSFILLYGGYTWNFFQSFNLQEQLDDLWVYSIDSRTWLPVYPNSDNNPSTRYGATLKYIDDSKFLLYGGMNSEKVFNDLWLFNMNSNMWTEIVRINAVVNENDWPLPVKFPSLIKFSRGLVLYGGGYYVSLNEKESNSTIFVSSGRASYILNDLWILYSDVCPKNCNDRGTCNYGRCLCNQGYFDSSCQNILCENSFCYTDKDIFIGQRCYHCSGHGKCNGQKCECDVGWRGIDCSIEDCLNNCTATSNPSIGYCVEVKPISQCICNEKLKRGGDDCSIIFCLNDCSSNGVCDSTKGTCTCKDDYYGLDCSVFTPEFRNNSNFLHNMNAFIILLSILILF